MKTRIILTLAVSLTALAAFGYAAYQYTGDALAYRNLEASISNGGGSGGSESLAGLDDSSMPSMRSSYDLSAHQTLSRVILLIREHYVEPERVKAYDMFLAALDQVEKTVPEVLVDDSEAPERVRVTVGDVAQNFDLGGLDQLWEVTMALRDIFRFLQGHITDPEKRRDIEYAAINGMLSSLDPHSVLLKPESFDDVKMSTKGEFGGLGIVIAIRDTSLTIISPIEGTPASRSGLRAKDKIVRIGEESTINMSLEEAVQRLRGKPGTKIDIWVQRQGWTEPRRYTLTRAIIKIESVNSKLLARGVGYIRIKNFQNNTYDDLHTHLESLRKQNKKEISGLILDLRNNPGGLLDQATYISDRFIQKGPLVITVGEGNRRREVKPAHAAGTENSYPIAVLVNGGSASASEIVAGAIKNHNRGVVIGQSTFGKGSVQVLYDFKDGSALKLTIAQYLTPGDVSIQSVGITPDVEVRPSYIADDRLHLFVDDESPRERDLSHHLLRHGESDENTSKAMPQARVVNLVDIEEEEDAEAEAASDKFRSDFEIELAHDVLVKTPTPHRKTMLEAAKGVFEKRNLEQEDRIGKRLSQFGVDWQAAPKKPQNSANASLSVESVELREDGKPRASNADAKRGYTRVEAGNTLGIIATLTNTGDAPIYRAYAVSTSENYLLKNLEFAFGKLEPGESRKWQVKVKVPDDYASRADEIVITAKDAAETLNVNTKSVVSILEQEKPRFSYSYVIDDTQGGNGDGVLQVGEDVELRVFVRNLGPGAAKEAQVTLKNMSGREVFLKRGREKLGEMKAGDTGSAALAFSVREETKEAKLRLAVWDSTLGSSISEKLVLPVLPARQVSPQNQMLQVSGDQEIPVHAGASTALPIVAYAKPGAILKSTGSVEGWRRVELEPKVFGFVTDSSVTPGPKNVRRTAKNAVRLTQPQSAPDMMFKIDSYVTSADTLRLQGTLMDERRLKDMYVFVNDKKVYYRTLRNTSSSSSEGGVQARVDINVPLKEGSNAVAIVVRESEDVFNRRVFGIYRSGRGGLAGALQQPNPQ